VPLWINRGWAAVNAATEPRKSAAVRNFIAFWNALREPGRLPDSSAFLSRPERAVHPHCFVHEMHDDGRIIPRFIGSAVVDSWGDDLTGQDIAALMKNEGSQAFFGSLRTAMHFPCGYWEFGVWVSPKGHTDNIEIMALPLGTEDGRVKRLAGLCRFDAKGWSDSSVQGHFNLVARSWHDAGWGVPAESLAG